MFYQGRPVLVRMARFEASAQEFRVTAQLRLELRQQFHERVDHLRVEQRATPGDQGFDGAFDRQCRAVGPVGGERVEVVDHGQNAGRQRNFLALQAAGIAAAVPAFVMAANQFGNGEREVHGRENLSADLDMACNLAELLWGEAAGLAEKLLGDGDLPDVVEQGAELERANLGPAAVESFADFDAVELDALEVRTADAVLGFDGEGKGFDSA